jgi:hypothetical protein
VWYGRFRRKRSYYSIRKLRKKKPDVRMFISSFSDISPIRRLPRGILVARLLGGLVLGDLVAVAGV